MSVILRATGCEPAARLAVLHTQVCVRGRLEATAMPVGCHAAGPVVKTLQCWFELATFWPCFQTTSNTLCCLSWLVGVFVDVRMCACISSSTVYQSG